MFEKIGYLFVGCMLCFAPTAISGQQQKKGCWTAKDCSGCMQAGPTCVWCEDKNFTSNSNSTEPRCNEIHLLTSCNNIKSLESSNNVTESEDFSSIIQVKPQRVKLEMRQGQSQSFRIAVQRAENFPVDLYFLMDRSASMTNDLTTIFILTDLIAKAIGNITTAYRLGVGGYIDKRLSANIPVGVTADAYPCNGTSVITGPCRPSFAFVHYFDFSNNITAFQTALIRLNLTSGDIDDSESPFDGLMQLAVCGEEINWHTKGQGRRIVLIISDALPKLAGDGKLLGAIKPHNGKCHMEPRLFHGHRETFDSKAEEMDYPSIQQLKRAMFENDITPLLAVTEDVLPIYKVIAKEWNDLGSSADLLSNDSSNIVQLIKDNYNRISTTVILTDNANAAVIKIEYKVDRSSCENPDRDNQCSNVKLNQTVFFDVKATLLSCPDNPNEPQQVTINAYGFGQILIDLQFLCECNCSKEYNSSFCSSRGTAECGICRCNPGWFGFNCKCDSSEPFQNGTATCIDPQSTNGEICNRAGKCVCGRCECHEKEFPRVVTGEYCDCLNYGCPRYNETECGGEERGICVCGECKCNELYQGDNCGRPNCSVVNDTKCTETLTGNGLVCSGKGECDCISQTCNCYLGNVGDFCEQCTSKECKCATIYECMRCELKNETCDHNLNCSMHTFISSNETFPSDCALGIDRCNYGVNFTGDPFIKNESLIVTYRLIGCDVVGTLGSNDDETATILAYILGIIGGILLLALILLLLWKLLVTIHDKKEYKRFQKSKENGSLWEKDGNPIYQEPTQKFDNPAFLSD